jgi:hypothetical protein
MDSFFRAVAIGLGVLMGTFNPGVEPELRVAPHKTETALQFDAELQRAVSPKMEEALEEGVPMALTMQAWVDGRPGPAFTRVLAFQAVGRQWSVTRAGEESQRFATRAEAERAWQSWRDAVAGPLPRGAFLLEVRVELSFPDRPDWKADMVWKTPVVSWSKSYTRPSQVPY